MIEKLEEAIENLDDGHMRFDHQSGWQKIAHVLVRILWYFVKYKT